MNVITKLFEGFKQVRIVILNGITWFVAKDVCDILEYKSPREILSRYVKDSDKMTVTNCDGHSGQRGGAQYMTVITQEGVLDLCLHSRMPRAKEFQHWITHNVVPEIMSTGMYITPEKANDMSNDPRYSELLAERDMYLAERNYYEKQVAQLTGQVSDLQNDLYEEQHKLDIVRPDGKRTLYMLLDDDNNIAVSIIKNKIKENDKLRSNIDNLNNTINAMIGDNAYIDICTLAKLIWNTDSNIGRNKLYDLLCNDKYIMRNNNNVWIPTQYAINAGYLILSETNGVKVLVTPLGRVFFINRYSGIRL